MHIELRIEIDTGGQQGVDHLQAGNAADHSKRAAQWELLGELRIVMSPVRRGASTASLLSMAM